jgi:signal transduction histidine kinase/ActR/RegA family two-component response regulator
VSDDRSDVILILAPVGRDADLMGEQLRAAGIRAIVCRDIDDLCTRFGDGAGAIIVTEEALPQTALGKLSEVVSSQPPWSEVPMIVLTGAPSIESYHRSFDALARRTNVTLIDRPVRIKSLVSAVQSALRARQRQYDIRDLMAQLEQRINERDRFLAVLGHELRNPLGAILLASQMTDDDARLDGDQARLIERQSRHLTRLVNDLLDLSRVAAGKIVLKPQPLDLRDVASQSIRVVQPFADQERIAISYHAPFAPLVVYADPVRVEQIITNILTNAVKYTPEHGHIHVTLDADDDEAVIRVKDNGVGIAPERIGVIFELFAQAENAIGRAQGGMGIGLALVRNLVQLHDGRVEARSDGDGKGSEFTVRLPLAKHEQRALPGRTQMILHDETPAGVRKIVIVEDNSDVRDLLRLKLKRLGHVVADARDGLEGLRVVLAEKPDLALVDLGLPGIDGFQIAREVRERLGKNVILVAVSGFGQPDDKRRAIEAGFDEHITKPADVNDIESVLKRFPPRNSTPQQSV